MPSVDGSYQDYNKEINPHLLGFETFKRRFLINDVRDFNVSALIVHSDAEIHSLKIEIMMDWKPGVIYHLRYRNEYHIVTINSCQC